MLFSLAVTAKGESPAVNPPHFMGILEVLADQTKLWKPEIFRTNRIGFAFLVAHALLQKFSIVECC